VRAVLHLGDRVGARWQEWPRRAGHLRPMKKSQNGFTRIGWRGMARGTSGAEPISTPPRSALHVLVDTNVVLDLLLARQPWLAEAQAIWEARDDGRLRSYLSAAALTDIFYVCRKWAGIDPARKAVDVCLQGFSIIAVDRSVLIAAHALQGNDFEDNVQIACAESAGLDLIVTRNSAHFAQSPIPAIEPAAVAHRLR
jgi:predicted nucleic acid-binding protein